MPCLSTAWQKFATKLAGCPKEITVSYRAPYGYRIIQDHTQISLFIITGRGCELSYGAQEGIERGE
jgi:hypothetical protein